MPHVLPEPLPRTPEALLLSDMARVSKRMPREGVGAARAQVGHVVANRGSPEVPLIYTVFTKKYQKRSTLGYPLFLTHFQGLSA